jgi:uncharacterized protein (TIGR02231 family)
MVNMNAYNLSLFGLFLSSAFLQAVSVTAPVEEIRLYRSGGEAVRHVNLDNLSPGDSIEIRNLPGNTEPDGFRARVVDGSGIRLGNLRFERLNAAELPTSSEREAKEAELKTIQRSLEDLKGRIGAAQERVQVFASLRNALIRGIEESPETDTAERIWEAFEGEQSAKEAKLELERNLSGQLDQLEEQRQQVERELQEIRRVEQALNGILTIEVLGGSAEPVVIELSSRFQGAGWEPVYRIDARPEAELWQLDYQARLHNRTGEVWDAVDLTLLTGQPGWRMEAPELPPVYLQKPRPVEPYATRQAKGQAMELAAFSVMADSAAPEVERLTTQFTLQLPVPTSLDAFEDGKLVDLEQRELAATFWSAVTPALEETAYLHGEATVDLQWPILPGPATLLVDGAVAGKTHLGLINPGDELELGFGENPAIVVEHKVLDVMDRDTGVFDKVRRYKRHYEAEIRNLMPVAHTVRVNSRFPVSRDEEIEVKRIEPTGIDVDAETGRFHWERLLAPGADVVFSTQFEVTAPRDWELIQPF